MASEPDQSENQWSSTTNVNRIDCGPLLLDGEEVSRVPAHWWLVIFCNGRWLGMMT